MKFLIVFVATLAFTLALPTEEYVKLDRDNLGNYKVSYSTGDIVRSEEGTSNGEVAGTYSFVDLDGNTQNVAYTAGVNGFQPTGNFIPKPVAEEPAVTKAHQEHLEAYNKVLLTVPRTEEFIQKDKEVMPEHFRVYNKEGLIPVVKYVEKIVRL